MVGGVVYDYTSVLLFTSYLSCFFLHSEIGPSQLSWQ